MSRSFARLLNATASTKRATVDSTTGRRAAPSAYLSDVTCTQLYPVDSEIRQRLVLQGPHELHQVFVDGAVDVREGDVWVQNSAEYPVRSVADWPWRGNSTAYKQIVIEELKR